MSEIGEIVRERVRAARLARGLTQAQLAHTAGVASETLSRLERGRQSPRLDHLVAVANALETTVAALVGGVAPKPKEDALPAELNGIVHALRGRDADTLRRVRQLVDVALALRDAPRQ